MPAMKTTISNTLVFALVSALLIVVGCGGGDSSGTDVSSEAPAEAPARVDVCSLLTSEDIEQVLGAAPGAPSPGDEGRGECIWPEAAGTAMMVGITLDDGTLDSFDEFVTDFGEEFGGENPPPDEYHAVEGVPGDWAMYVAEEHTVRAFSGGDEVRIEVPGAEEAQVVELASRAMGRR